MNKGIIESIKLPDAPFNLGESMIALMRRGSEAHGTYIPPEDNNGFDDHDYLMIVVCPPEYYLGLRKWEGAESIKDSDDVVIYDIRKYMRLLGQQNPNVVYSLYLAVEDYLYKSMEFAMILSKRSEIVSRTAAYNSISGYSRGQYKRMRSPNDGGFLGEKRRMLFGKYGYDCKNAAHTVRLLHLGTDYLTTGKMVPKLTGNDRELILNIKKGNVSIEEVCSIIEEGFHGLDIAYENSSLPMEVNFDLLSKITMDTIMDHLGLY